MPTVAEPSANASSVDCAVETGTSPLRVTRPFARMLGLLKGFMLIAPFAFLLVASFTALVGSAVRNGGPATSDLDGDFAMFYTATHVSQAHGDP